MDFPSSFSIVPEGSFSWTPLPYTPKVFPHPPTFWGRLVHCRPTSHLWDPRKPLQGQRAQGQAPKARHCLSPLGVLLLTPNCHHRYPYCRPFPEAALAPLLKPAKRTFASEHPSFGDPQAPHPFLCLHPVPENPMTAPALCTIPTRMPHRGAAFSGNQ